MRGIVALCVLPVALSGCVQETYEYGPEGERRLVENPKEEAAEGESHLARPHLRVTEVVSGDTIVLEDGRRIRYAGVEAPGSGEKWFDECRRANEDLVRGRRVVLDPKGQRSDGDVLRALVWVEMKPEDIVAEGAAYSGSRVGYIWANWAMIRSGSARFVEDPAAGNQIEALRTAEAAAKSKKIGVWQN